MSDERDQELLDLLKETPEESPRQSRPSSGSYAKKKAQRKAQKKQKLMTTVIALVSVATVGLAGVLAVTLAKEPDSGNDAQIQALMEENQLLKAQNQELEDQVEELSNLMNDLYSEMEFVEGDTVNSDGKAEFMGKMEAYESLVNALNAMLTYDEEALNQALAELDGKIELLSSDAQNAYYMVLEYMEQPYWGLQ